MLKKILPKETAQIGCSKFHLVLVGCGGTGSFLAGHIARLLTGSVIGETIEDVLLIDGDSVESKNVGRQLFSKRDIGMNKAEVLANRYNQAFGLDIYWCPEFLTRENFSEIIPDSNRNHPVLILGCLDTTATRKIILDKVTDKWGNQAWFPHLSVTLSRMIFLVAVVSRQPRIKTGWFRFESGIISEKFSRVRNSGHQYISRPKAWLYRLARTSALFIPISRLENSCRPTFLDSTLSPSMSRTSSMVSPITDPVKSRAIWPARKLPVPPHPTSTRWNFEQPIWAVSFGKIFFSMASPFFRNPRGLQIGPAGNSPGRRPEI